MNENIFPISGQEKKLKTQNKVAKNKINKYDYTEKKKKKKKIKGQATQLEIFVITIYPIEIQGRV